LEFFVFENILHQKNIIDQLKADIEGGSMAPSLLFSGPEYSGKGTAAMELARVLCCEEKTPRGKWNCTCSSCVRHRNLVSQDMLLLGKRLFFQEVAAASKAFLCQTDNYAVKMLFIRSVRKLLARFNPVLWEDDPKLGKFKTQIGALEEELEDFESSSLEEAQIAKMVESIGKKAAKLEAEGLGELIPIAHIRKAAYWSHLSPLGNHKCVIIEGAENMQDGAKNSLLKILEEPPPSLTIILTSSRPMSLLPTMLSRLREYRFAARNINDQTELIGRIYREEFPPDHKKITVQAYLSSFLPVNSDTLYGLGAFFTASIAANAVLALKKEGRKIPPALEDMGKYAAPIAEKSGMGRPALNGKDALDKILAETEHFGIPGLFTGFLRQCCALLSRWLRGGGQESADALVEKSADKTAYADLWRRELEKSGAEHDTFNISPPLVLERLFEALKTGMA
jgi:DNA polymerase-3 subunit gamma/tau